MRSLFYVESLPGVGGTAVVDGDEGHHAATVRRTRVGEELDLSDGAGTVAHVVVEEAVKGRLTARVLSVRTVPRPSPAVTIVQALPKSERSELAIELATEAGADAFLAWQAHRCVARWESAAKVDKGLRRWEAVARSAARQSRRPHIPEVGGLVSTTDLLARVPAALTLVLHESATVPLAEAGVADAESVLLVVGPEGGISEQELAALTGAGARAVRLGPSVLRTSTAAAVALGAIGVLSSRWDVDTGGQDAGN
ncbi:16S rRNA (uracil(1498)-N(3))-methyltransferase [Mycolicibacterium diernhoferi]|uniref:Ribosomal RNA small subunit methyltransferase E n=1 Tax=Mycolicibacterium diernhoferi TaxID=1801 RepID=A0A1Q4HLT8_9MYCO|nr:16S rRNA (uracil(1498)-N(3))-methyltransferase [Mycolicibacterium diernhoferi]OJZ68412.1 16S rRNA (uracil(1498)-N(3))-methyltransferase [Mycolicibacterium diernhoferi]OPE53043.1 16S rRNA (uracil(1498)-N(3))-methyltransferase [Mycolicibacterium diernhoferi]PEG52771.1 16S rRNA (uracil(1498)-N(3))-methyltransferase [Mycolicibacterium diernhoferi]QYL21091.1 16S rRNA (uracil(1498)-N(3))-methyltransferase [Mycolicibacterium diernhoferi]